MPRLSINFHDRNGGHLEDISSRQFPFALNVDGTFVLLLISKFLPLTPRSQETKAYDPIKCITAENQILSILLFNPVFHHWRQATQCGVQIQRDTKERAWSDLQT